MEETWNTTLLIRKGKTDYYGKGEIPEGLLLTRQSIRRG